MKLSLGICKGECYDVPIPWYRVCYFCNMKEICRNDCGELADKDSEHCRFLHYHKKEILERLK